ncbi:MAG TPA: flagellar biosynthetic protein FliO [Eoetvoesiella sp.]
MSEASLLRLIISLVFIVGLILAGAWLTRRAGWLRAGTSQPIKLVGSQSLGSRAYVALVEVENARLVLGVTANQISLLHTLPASEQQLSTSSIATSEPDASFAKSLRQIMSRRRV